MIHIGCHLSSSEGYYHMGQTALELGADTFQFFTRNPRGGKAKELDPADVQHFQQLAAEHQLTQILAHAPYTLNPCSATAKTREFAHLVMADDLQRLEATPRQFYNFHPGSHTGQGVAQGITLITALLNAILKPEQTTTVLLETMAGKGSEVGSHFEELAAIIGGVRLQEKLGICLDTCHIFDAGYDIVSDLDGVLADFDRILGLDRLKFIHLNDSLYGLGSHKDRHACLGQGKIGLAALRQLVRHPRLREKYFVLETPNDLEGYRREIALVHSWC
ncbi:MAG: deoxyribonuclease IV [Acidaminococcaceae bacterium]|jgi:deoxyribonuclease-4|nr:deoxyribonuclease IV [Acidaminococcaceae bacterium]